MRKEPSQNGAGSADPTAAEVRMLTSSVVYADQWLTFRRDEIERNDGSRGTYAFVEKRNFALIIPAENGGFHLVEEYRYPLGRRGNASFGSSHRDGLRLAVGVRGLRPAGRGVVRDIFCLV